MLVAHILSANLNSSWPRRQIDRVYDYGSEDFRLETFQGFSLSYGRIQWRDCSCSTYKRVKFDLNSCFLNYIFSFLIQLSLFRSLIADKTI